MNTVDELLSKMGLSYEDLTVAEKDTYDQMLSSVEQNELSLPRLRDFIGALRDQVEQELTKHDLSKEQDLFLKARLRNLMLIEAFMRGPEKAKAALEAQLRHRR